MSHRSACLACPPPARTRRVCRRARAFTLVEVLVATTLSGLVLAAVLSSYIFLGHSLARLASQQALEAKGRAALDLLRQDFGIAQAVKTGTSPTTTAVTLTLPGGDVSYTYDFSAGSLRRQATFGANRDQLLLANDLVTCTAFSFDYYTTTGGAPTSQFTSGVYVPYGIKQIQVRFTLETPGHQSADTHATLGLVSSRFLLRNKAPATGA